MKGQLWYNQKRIREKGVFEYYFAMINQEGGEDGMIYNISSQIEKELGPIPNSKIKEGRVIDVLYKVLVFESPEELTEEKLSSIFDGETERDSVLYARARLGIKALEKYVISEIRLKQMKEKV